jgi:hypothetical protein
MSCCRFIGQFRDRMPHCHFPIVSDWRPYEEATPELLIGLSRNPSATPDVDEPLQLVMRRPTDSSEVITMTVHHDMGLTVLQEDFISFYSSSGMAVGAMFTTGDERVAFEKTIAKLLALYDDDAAFLVRQTQAAAAVAAPEVPKVPKAPETWSATLLDLAASAADTGRTLLAEANLLGPSEAEREYAVRAQRLSIAASQTHRADDVITDDLPAGGSGSESGTPAASPLHKSKSHHAHHAAFEFDEGAATALAAAKSRGSVATQPREPKKEDSPGMLSWHLLPIVSEQLCFLALNIVSFTYSHSYMVFAVFESRLAR